MTEPLPVTVIVLNNGKFSFVELEMQASGYPRFATDLDNPDFAEFAKACGGDGIRITKPTEIRPALEIAFTSQKPVVIDAVVNPNELVIPPKIAPSVAWGFTMGKVKELWGEFEKSGE